jgi:hypothetical protein
MKADALMCFILSGNRSLEEFAVSSPEFRLEYSSLSPEGTSFSSPIITS